MFHGFLDGKAGFRPLPLQECVAVAEPLFLFKISQTWMVQHKNSKEMRVAFTLKPVDDVRRMMLLNGAGDTIRKFEFLLDEVDHAPCWELAGDKRCVVNVMIVKNKERAQMLKCPLRWLSTIDLLRSC